MTMDRTYHRLFGLAVVLMATISVAEAQAPPAKDMADLLATLKEKGLTTIQKNRLVGSMYSGVVEVLDVKEVERYGADAAKAKPAARIMVAVGASNPNWFLLAFETTDVENASKLRKGEKVSLSGKLIRFDVHSSGYRNVTDDEWVVFEQVVIGAK